MRSELFPFQKRAVSELRKKVADAMGSYHLLYAPQVVSFTAPTGSGKTIIMAALIEDILFGTETWTEQQDAIFVWLSDSPSLNEQSKQKIDLKADRIRIGQCMMIDEASFDMEMLEDGHIYFLNTQKLSKSGKLTQHADGRQYTIWETLQNTAKNKHDRLYFIIDEAHRGMQGREAGKATSIMQKFLKGSPRDHLEPMPVVIGMSATSARFERLVENITSTVHKVIVTPAEVRASGLLKDRIIISYPKDTDNRNDMAILQAAADEWKNKCEHWYQYSYEQHYAQVNPVLVIQVLNTAGTGATSTDIGDCIRIIEERTGYTFSEGEVAHTFGQTGTITENGLRIPHVEPSSIADDKRIRVVFFKENLSTGWDCPRAETMMSFRRADDATYIAQLLGRMIRTPMQCHILVDDSLNEVHLYLPHFNSENVARVVEELQNAEGGEIPTVIEGEELGSPNYATWTVRPNRRSTDPLPGQVGLFDVPLNVVFGSGVATGVNVNGSAGGASEAPVEREVRPQQVPTPATSSPVHTQEEPLQENPAQIVQQTQMATLLIDREEVTRFINNFGLLNYEVRNVRIHTTYLQSLFGLARVLVQSGIDINATLNVRNEIVQMIREYVESLKANGTYDDLSAQVLQLKLASQIFDAFGESVDNYSVHGSVMMSDTDLDRQLRQADAQLGNCGICNRYGGLYFDDEEPNSFKIEVILFAADEERMNRLGQYAERKFHELNNRYRLYFNQATDSYRRMYRSVVADSAEVTEHSFRLPETWQVRREPDGRDYENHLFVDENTGVARIKLNTWETGVLEEEARRADFVCWLRNPSGASWSLCIPYEINGTTKRTYPDFIIIRHNPAIGYILDILEPHSQDFADNLAKAKGFAKYMQREDRVGRLQLIRKSPDAAGQNRFRRLDLADGMVRNKVLQTQTIEELNHIFDTDGFFEQ